MKAVELRAKWNPTKGYTLTVGDVEGKKTYLSSKVWSNPSLSLVERPIPEVGPDEVLLKIQACGICGTDVHLLQTKEDGRMMYPGLTAFPCILGHELSGTVVEAGVNAINKRTRKRYEAGELVCAEEMVWCGRCKPCADGYPNHCEALEELGITVDGGFAEYIKVDAKLCWDLSELIEVYGQQKAYLLGSLVEPTSVAHNAVIERGGGIRPGDNVWILGSGPVGLAACAILKRAGAKRVIMSEPSKQRREMALGLGATDVIDPAGGSVPQQVLEITGGYGANLILEATGLPEVVWPDIENVIWNGRTLNATVVIVARADQRIPLNGEIFQVRRANIVGSQGHSGHGTFHRVISMMAGGMDMTPIITETVSMDKIPDRIRKLQTDRTNCKISYVAGKQR
jgi:threonine dehydrogenase-like Zn-dependent dehydrogenase